MTIFLTGASGLVGSAFARAAARRGHRVIGIVGSHAAPLEGVVEQATLDLTAPAAVTAAVLERFPQAIVNCAAVSVPEQCDADPAHAQALNVELPATLARLAHHLSARLVHLSSEQVFDGTRATAYTPGDPVCPINLYGRQKVESERLVHSLARDFAVTVRPPLLMGNSVSGRRSNHERLFADWAAGRTPRMFTDEFRQACTAENLAEVLVELCERDTVRGIVHWAGRELLSRHELACRIRDHFRLSAAQAPLAAVARAEVPDLARRRQACLALDLTPLEGRLRTRPEDTTTQLAGMNVPPPCRDWYLGLT
jgi:dTDP-4-dehydrorhamnose reductase